MKPKFLGIIEGAAEGALRISTGVGESQLAISDQALLAVRAAAEDRERVAAVVNGLSGGDRKAALAALYPNLPAKALNLILSLADSVTEALADDGQLDQAELMQIALRLVQEAL